VLKWVFERCQGTAKALETPIGLLPSPSAIDTSGLDLSEEDMAELLGVDTAGWLEEIPKLREWYAKFGDHLPKELGEELEGLELRLRSAR
jgi:phosphoenolpyruvate carboxykinase (GTP)